MATDPIARPTFYEGQVLAAADLQATLAYPRDQMARHERFLHSWGIASGLQLTQDSNGAIWVEAGMAIDGTGREIVVPVREPLPEADFSSVLQSSSTPIHYPVFLVAADKTAPATTGLSGLCNDAQPSRVAESYQYEFGRPGDELSLDEQPVPDVADGPGGDPQSGQVWRILLGFVGEKNGKPDSPVDPSPESQVGRRYSGVRADDVSARGTTLTLHTSNGAQGKPVLRMDETDGALLTFGLQGAAPVFTVNAKGDLIITGKFGTGTPKGSAVLAQSGVASDGVILPLPTGVTRPMVKAGQVTLHVQVTPRATNDAPPTSDALGWGAFPLQCTVDDDFRVHCAVRWVWLKGGAPPGGLPSPFDAPSSCIYTLLAVFPPDTR
jgi:hypothetical protein